MRVVLYNNIIVWRFMFAIHLFLVSMRLSKTSLDKWPKCKSPSEWKAIFKPRQNIFSITSQCLAFILSYSCVDMLSEYQVICFPLFESHFFKNWKQTKHMLYTYVIICAVKLNWKQNSSAKMRSIIQKDETVILLNADIQKQSFFFNLKNTMKG